MLTADGAETDDPAAAAAAEAEAEAEAAAEAKRAAEEAAAAAAAAAAAERRRLSTAVGVRYVRVPPSNTTRAQRIVTGEAAVSGLLRLPEERRGPGHTARVDGIMALVVS